MNANKQNNTVIYQLVNATMVGVLLVEVFNNTENVHAGNFAQLFIIHLFEAILPQNFLSHDFMLALNLYNTYMAGVDCVYGQDNTLPNSNFGFFQNTLIATSGAVNAIHHFMSK